VTRPTLFYLEKYVHIRRKVTHEVSPNPANVDQVAVKAGIAHWEQHTCLKFDLTTNENQPHLKFQKLSGCWSYVGYISQFSTGQDISIGQGCTSVSSPPLSVLRCKHT